MRPTCSVRGSWLTSNKRCECKIHIALPHGTSGRWVWILYKVGTKQERCKISSMSSFTGCVYSPEMKQKNWLILQEQIWRIQLVIYLFLGYIVAILKFHSCYGEAVNSGRMRVLQVFIYLYCCKVNYVLEIWVDEPNKMWSCDNWNLIKS